MRIGIPQLIVLALFVGVSPARAEQDKMILTSVREPASGSLSVMLTEDPRGLRTLRVSLPAGGNAPGRTPERVQAEDVSVRAFNDADLELVLLTQTTAGPIGAICNAGSCYAIAHYRFNVPNASLDRLRKVVVVLKGKRYEITMRKYDPAKP